MYVLVFVPEIDTFSSGEPSTVTVCCLYWGASSDFALVCDSIFNSSDSCFWAQEWFYVYRLLRRSWHVEFMMIYDRTTWNKVTFGLHAAKPPNQHNMCTSVNIPCERHFMCFDISFWRLTWTFFYYIWSCHSSLKPLWGDRWRCFHGCGWECCFHWWKFCVFQFWLLAFHVTNERTRFKNVKINMYAKFFELVHGPVDGLLQFRLFGGWIVHWSCWSYSCRSRHHWRMTLGRMSARSLDLYQCVFMLSSGRKVESLVHPTRVWHGLLIRFRPVFL